MMRVRFDDKEGKVAISVKCKLSENVEREFNLNRSSDEAISDTFAKLQSNVVKQLGVKKSTKKLKKDESVEVVVENELNNEINLSLYDANNQLVPLSTRNKDAWKENYLFKINEQSFPVAVNLPHLKKLNLSKVLIAGMPAVVKIDVESEEQFEKVNQHSKFLWYFSKETFLPEDAEAEKVKEAPKPKKHKVQVDFEKMQWVLMNEGVNAKMYVLSEECESRYVKVLCVPSDGEREGKAVECVSNHLVRKKIDLDILPMTDRHKLTANRLSSDNLRVMTYNILANCYSDTSLAKEHLFVYCPLEYLEFKYRRVLLIHEIRNYNSDVIFLQECESDFFEEDLKSSMPGYTHLFKAKTESKEGEAILFRSDRFRFIKSHDIEIADELTKNPFYEKLCSNIFKNTELKELISGRNTILQVAQVESLDQPGHHFLLANTHLFFHPKADFIRLIQAIVSAKYLEKLKHNLAKEVPRISILFGGDFNSDPPSHAFTYIFTQAVPINNLNPDECDLLKDCEEAFMHSLNLSAYADFPFTNCTNGFEGILDYVFYETNNFELAKVIPLPSVERVKENVAIPSQLIPSDHLALVFELKIK